MVIHDLISKVPATLLFFRAVAKPARQFGHAMQIFRVHRLRKQSIFKEMNNDLKFA